MEDIAQALPSDLQKTPPEELAASTNGVREMIRSGNKGLRVTAKPFRSTGISELQCSDDGEPYMMQVAIRAVSLAKIEAIRTELYVRMPPVPEVTKTKPGSPLEMETHRGENDPGYRRAVRELQTEQQFAVVLWGIADDIYDESEELVWEGSNDDEGARGDEAAGLKALKALGFSGNHFDQLRDDIDRLTLSESQLEENERQKKFLWR